MPEAEPLPQTTVDQLKQLEDYSTVIPQCDNLQSLATTAPQDAIVTANLLANSLNTNLGESLLEYAVAENERSGFHGEALIARDVQSMMVLAGCKLLETVSGRISCHIDPRFSFDTNALVSSARDMIERFQNHGVLRERTLIAIPATWEGIHACEILEKERIHVNMLLVFSQTQAAAAAAAGASMICCCLGRITDWFQQKTGQVYTGREDPGLEVVSQIYNYLKKYGFRTELSVGCFRYLDQVRAMAGCDIMVVQPELLNELASSYDFLDRSLDPEAASSSNLQRFALQEKDFRWHLNADPMATAKLAEGIRSLASDFNELEEIIERELLER